MPTSDDIPALIDDLDSMETPIRQAARARLLALGAITVEPLIEAMRRPTARQCWEAATLLAQVDDPRWREPMIEALRSPNPVLASVAAGALERYGSDALEPLLAVLPTSKTIVQLQIVKILGRIGDGRAVEALMSLLEQTESTDLRHSLIEALGMLGDRRAIPLIQSFTSDENHHVQERLQTALKRLEASTRGEDG